MQDLFEHRFPHKGINMKFASAKKKKKALESLKRTDCRTGYDTNWASY